MGAKLSPEDVARRVPQDAYSKVEVDQVSAGV